MAWRLDVDIQSYSKEKAVKSLLQGEVPRMFDLHKLTRFKTIPSKVWGLSWSSFPQPTRCFFPSVTCSVFFVLMSLWVCTICPYGNTSQPLDYCEWRLWLAKFGSFSGVHIQWSNYSFLLERRGQWDKAVPFFNHAADHNFTRNAAAHNFTRNNKCDTC